MHFLFCYLKEEKKTILNDIIVVDDYYHIHNIKYILILFITKKILVPSVKKTQKKTNLNNTYPMQSVLSHEL